MDKMKSSLLKKEADKREDALKKQEYQLNKKCEKEQSEMQDSLTKKCKKESDKQKTELLTQCSEEKNDV